MFDTLTRRHALPIKNDHSSTRRGSRGQDARGALFSRVDLPVPPLVSPAGGGRAVPPVRVECDGGHGQVSDDDMARIIDIHLEKEMRSQEAGRRQQHEERWKSPGTQGRRINDTVHLG